MDKQIFNFNNLKPILKGRIPGQLIIQYTDFCNATCPQCGMRKTESYERSKLDEDEIKRIIDAAADKNIQSLSFTGGEPFIFKDPVYKQIWKEDLKYYNKCEYFDGRKPSKLTEISKEKDMEAIRFI